MNFFCDLSHTVLLPYQLLLDISLQLRVHEPHLSQRILRPMCELNETNDWINLEARGHTTAIRAHELCQALAKSSSFNRAETLNIYIKLQAPIGSDNLYGLLELSKEVDKLNVYLTTSESDKTSQEILQNLADDIDNIHLNMAPLDVFAAQCTEASWQRINQYRMHQLKAICPALIHPCLIQKDEDVYGVIQYAWIAIKTGAYAVSECVLELALASPSPLNTQAYELLFAHMQAIRFLSHQYHLVADTPYPESFQHSSAAEQKRIYFLKAYAATLARKPEIAKPYFERCQIHPKMPLVDEDSLYQLNIFALFQVITGNIDVAYECEMRIEEKIKSEAIESTGLRYVNFINIARLYKKINHLDKATNYYQKAYAEIKGGYSLSDYIYFYLNFAGIYEAQQRYNEALMCWAKALIYWQAMPNPHELSWRPRLLITKENMQMINRPLSIKAVNQSFVHHIERILQQLSWKIDKHAYVPKAVKLIDEITDTFDDCIASNHMIFYVKAEAINIHTQALAQKNETLMTYLSFFLEELFNIKRANQTLYIDKQLEPFDYQDNVIIKAYAALYGCKTYQIAGTQSCSDASMPINYDLNHNLIKDIIFQADGCQIKFKRSFMNAEFKKPSDIKWLKNLSSQALDSEVHDIEQLRLMHHKKVITLVNKP